MSEPEPVVYVVEDDDMAHDGHNRQRLAQLVRMFMDFEERAGRSH